MEICTVDEYNAPADHRAIIANIRTSALAAGWTVEEYRAADEVWQQNVGWSAGSQIQKHDLYDTAAYNGCFLQLKGSGFGNQGPNNRFRIYGFTTDDFRVSSGFGYGTGVFISANYGQKHVVSFGWPTQANYITNSLYPPHGQDNKWGIDLPSTIAPFTSDYINYPNYRSQIVPSVGAIKQWVITYGTNLIHNIINIDNVYMEHTLFGVIDLFDTTHVGGYFHQHNQLTYTYGTSTYPPAASDYTTNASGFYSPELLVDGTYVSATYMDCNRLGNNRGRDYYDDIILQNTWSGKRVIHVPTVHAQLSGLLCPVGRMWYGILNTENLTPGQVLTYGSEQYQVWPVYSVTYPNTYGVAYRIA